MGDHADNRLSTPFKLKFSKIANRCLADVQKDRRLGDGSYIGRQTVRAQPYAHEHASRKVCVDRG